MKKIRTIGGKRYTFDLKSHTASKVLERKDMLGNKYNFRTLRTKKPQSAYLLFKRRKK